MSYIKLLVGYNTVVSKEWLINVNSAFDNLSSDDKSRFTLEQSVFVNYIKLVYNDKPPALLLNYIKSIINFVNCINEIELKDPDVSPEFKENVRYINELVKGSVPADTTQLLERLSQIAVVPTFPHVVDDASASFYRPYLTYFGSADYNASISDAVSIPTFALRGNLIFVGFSAKLIGFKMNAKVKELLEGGPYPIELKSFFGYLAGYNWRDSDLNTLLAILSTYSFDLDPTANRNSIESLYKLIKSIITGYKSSVDSYIDSLVSPTEESVSRKLFIAFLIALRKLYTLKLDDAQVLAKIIGNDKKEDIEDLSAYLEATKSSEISTEMVNAFNNSIFAEFEELSFNNRFFKKKVEIDLSYEKLLSASSLSSVKESLKALYLNDVKTTDTAALMDAGTTIGDNNQSAAPQSNNNQNAPLTDADFNVPKPGDVGATGADDTSGTKSDTNNQSQSIKSDDQEPTKEQRKKLDGDTKDDAHAVPDLPKVSDSRGVKLELSSSESTDTVFYRLELKTYINSILANPPKDLSVEKLEILKKIKSYWLNTLEVQCVHDILNTVIHLPSMFRIKSNKGKK